MGSCAAVAVEAHAVIKVGKWSSRGPEGFLLFKTEVLIQVCMIFFFGVLTALYFKRKPFFIVTYSWG